MTATAKSSESTATSGSPNSGKMLMRLLRLVQFFKANTYFTAIKVAKDTGLSYNAACRLLKAASQPGPDQLIHVILWSADTTGRPQVPTYTFGPGDNVRRPLPLKARVRKRNQRMRASPFSGLGKS